MAQSLRLRVAIVITTADGAPEQHLDDFRRALIGAEPRIAIESATLSSLVSIRIERQRLGMWLMSDSPSQRCCSRPWCVRRGRLQRVAARPARWRSGRRWATRGDVLWAIVRDTG
jgi:hypothetical protein